MIYSIELLITVQYLLESEDMGLQYLCKKAIFTWSKFQHKLYSIVFNYQISIRRRILIEYLAKKFYRWLYH